MTQNNWDVYNEEIEKKIQEENKTTEPGEEGKRKNKKLKFRMFFLPAYAGIYRF